MRPIPQGNCSWGTHTGRECEKRLYRHGLNEDFESHTHHVLMQLLLLFRSDDFKEGIGSFMEKREPKFSGR